MYKIYLPQELRSCIFPDTLFKFLDAGHQQGTLNKLREIFAALFLFLFFAQSQVEFIAVIKAQLPLTWPGLCLQQDQDLDGGGGYRGRGSSCACALMRRLSAVKSERHT